MNAISGMREGVMLLITVGNRTAFPNPCGVCVASPTGYCNACTAAVPADENAIPARRLARAISCLASRSFGRATAVGRNFAIAEIAFVARTSDIGFFPTKMACGEQSVRTLAQNDSIACASASMPECAVTLAGQETVKDGSTIAHFGISAREAMPTFMARSGSATTATGLTSDPVPAVVGTATTGAIAPGILFSP